MQARLKRPPWIDQCQYAAGMRLIGIDMCIARAPAHGFGSNPIAKHFTFIAGSEQPAHRRTETTLPITAGRASLRRWCRSPPDPVNPFRHTAKRCVQSWSALTSGSTLPRLGVVMTQIRQRPQTCFDERQRAIGYTTIACYRIDGPGRSGQWIQIQTFDAEQKFA